MAKTSGENANVNNVFDFWNISILEAAAAGRFFVLRWHYSKRFCFEQLEEVVLRFFF